MSDYRTHKRSGSMTTSLGSYGQSSGSVSLGMYSDQIIVSGVGEQDVSSSSPASLRRSPHTVVPGTDFLTEHAVCLIQSTSPGRSSQELPGYCPPVFTYDFTDTIHEHDDFLGRYNRGYFSQWIATELAGKGFIYPKIMVDYLSDVAETVLLEIEKLCEEGYFAYIGHSLLATLNKTLNGKFPDNVLCDVCIFRDDSPVLVLTILTDGLKLDRAKYYNSQLARAIVSIVRKDIADFSVNNGVLTLEQFHSSERFAEDLERIVSETSKGATAGAIQMNPRKCHDVIHLFLKQVNSCFSRSVKSVDSYYCFTGESFDFFSEMLEDRRRVGVTLPSSDYATLIVSEIVVRLSVVSKTVTVTCVQDYLKELENLRTLRNNVQVLKCPSTACEQESGPAPDVVVTTSWSTSAKWEFYVRHDYGLEDTPEGTARPASTTDNKEVTQARKVLASAIVDNAGCARSRGRDDVAQLEVMMEFTLQQCAQRAAIFLQDHLPDGVDVREFDRLNSFMEDYLMQSFRQRNLQLLFREDVGVSDAYIESIRKVSPILIRGLDLQSTPLMDRLISSDVMSEAGRESILARPTNHSRNKAFVTYLRGNFTHETFKDQFLQVLSEQNQTLAKEVGDELERLTVSSRRRTKCPFCKMKETVNIRQLADSLYQMNEISQSLQQDLSASYLPDTVRWSELFKQVTSMKTIMKALEVKNERLHREFITHERGLSKSRFCLECTCDHSEQLGAVAGSDTKSDVANMSDFHD
ncbi:uncharacterized protein LOC124256779 isoform X2 [Haliotis rubra]|uniref:uncharacterized protein LOC124256779 isoform X2 n=1 Tax=Haliotis rubra TaxID=36100 RepID=UPI001EE5F12B|nr:uncharacterized protein LOC124256779 isoform X2 [Haliotis rubra]